MEIQKVFEFIKELEGKVEFDRPRNKHWLGSKVLTNEELNKMCLNCFGKDYELLTDPEQNKFRKYIFRVLRGELDG